MTPAQKLKLFNLHSRYMTIECSSGNYNAREASNRLMDFTEYYESLGLEMREAEIISWEVCLNFDEISAAARHD